ncbi:MAG TPA: hypothetical protein VD971_08805 [Phycisphaerales bacterium]|nr:hypothetical protein [Phycisphaerales bacterium]
MWYLFTAIRCPGCGHTHDLAVPDGTRMVTLAEFEFDCPVRHTVVNVAALSVGAIRFEQDALPAGFIVARPVPGSGAVSRQATTC